MCLLIYFSFQKCIQIRFLCHKLIKFKSHEDYVFSATFVCDAFTMSWMVSCTVFSLHSMLTISYFLYTCSKTAVVFPSDKNICFLWSLILLSKIIGSLFVIYFYLYYRMVPLCSNLWVSLQTIILYRCWLYNDCSLS